PPHTPTSSPLVHCPRLLSFLWRHGDHRPLHSFPTRRSSDLHERLSPGPRAGDHRVDVADHRLRHPAVRQDHPVDVAHQPPGVVEDRKSTRLNSSHVKISYAVFCLKKKKQIILTLTFLRYGPD